MGMKKVIVLYATTVSTLMLLK